MERIVRRFFRKDEILFIEKFYTFNEKKKIVTFTPAKNVERLTAEMSKAGAGVIGNYEMCSFRTEGIGTFKPTAKANPVSGIKNLLSFEKEIKLEMECAPGNLNKVLDALLRHHPYEEVAYEIYDFRKRNKRQDGIVVELKTKILFRNFLTRLKKASVTFKNDFKIDSKVQLKRILFLTNVNKTDVFESAKIIKCDCIIQILKNNFQIYKL